MVDASSSPVDGPQSKTLDLSTLPPIFVSASHFAVDDRHALEDDLLEAGAALTFDIYEAGIVLSKATRKARVQYDFRAQGLWTEEVAVRRDSSTDDDGVMVVPKLPTPSPTQRREVSEVIVLEDSSTASEGGEARRKKRRLVHLPVRKTLLRDGKAKMAPQPAPTDLFTMPLIKVIKVEWFNASKQAGSALPLEDFMIFQGRKIDKPIVEHAADCPMSKAEGVRKIAPAQAPVPTNTSPQSIIERAKEDAPIQSSPSDRFGKRKFGHREPSKASTWAARPTMKTQHAHLLLTTTSEYDGDSSDLPEPPAWVRQGVKYACQRSTPRTNPNDVFLAQLKKIKIARLLTNDEIGVRAYSTSIAAIAAYPYKISSPKEILQLPGCDAKIANLFVEWANDGKIRMVDDIDANEDLQHLRLFYEIWDVGPTTAREFYFERGWKDLDDVVEYGWKLLSRTQQIGVKFYEEFLDPIPRKEVEAIGATIQAHAEKVRDKGIQSTIVGGYRRGKEASGDVDIIVSHPDESKTLNIINDLVASLEEEGWITHTLLLSQNNSTRDQQTLPFRAGKSGGHGFDSLDKALVVWQDPDWPTQIADLAADPKAKNPNIHRRVDIIISPWRTVGCAVEGWSSGTTFQRDLRRYVKHTRDWKFDSSGVRHRGSGEVIDVEGFYKYEGKIGKGRATSMVQAEMRMFEGVGLEWREPEERCTG
ncbi:hypothetical protein B0A48_01820 [Cryoendolithus antarcticus]|uniref:DNA-directed DNA polymerase n=1 Tax=Cryoendolithus antarcticus TaxID=1507870 RepID=A0A1V8TQQ7_9PEZI|nr:hypothetical protein B0A48_01820 [Cryoendolithus antarcticus]